MSNNLQFHNRSAYLLQKKERNLLKKAINEKISFKIVFNCFIWRSKMMLPHHLLRI